MKLNGRMGKNLITMISKFIYLHKSPQINEELNGSGKFLLLLHRIFIIDRQPHFFGILDTYCYCRRSPTTHFFEILPEYCFVVVRDNKIHSVKFNNFSIAF